MESLLSVDLVKQIRQVFEKLENPVQLYLFVSSDQEEACAPTRQLLEELLPLSDKLSMQVYDVEEDAELARHYQVEGKAPAIVIAARDGEQVIDYGIRYLGVPAGHEFGTLIQDLILVASRDSGLSPQLRTYIKSLTEPLHLEVFVTHT